MFVGFSQLIFSVNSVFTDEFHPFMYVYSACMDEFLPFMYVYSVCMDEFLPFIFSVWVQCVYG